MPRIYTDTKTRRCAWCAYPLTPIQRRYCSSLCTGLANVVKAGRVKWEPEDLQPCGTGAALRRHYRRGEPPCGDCRAWNVRDHQDRYQARRSRV